MKKCPLTGKPCNKHKCYHITDIENGEASAKDLCEDCAGGYIQGNEITPESQQTMHPPTDMVETYLEFMDFLQQQLVKDMELNTPDQALFFVQKKDKIDYIEITCPNCGISVQEIFDSGRFGCMKCWEHFGESLKLLLNKIHGSVKHVGKVPKNWESKKEIKSIEHKKLRKVESLMISWKLKMNDAIEIEDYELAAKCRDAIKTLSPILKEQEKLQHQMLEALADGDVKKAQELREGLQELLSRANEL